MQVYAVYYEASGRFLLGLKLQLGYFFYNPKTGGRIVPRGQGLNGGGKCALPGGKKEANETVIDGARREFLEETAAGIVAIRADEHQFKDHKHDLDYATAFFRIQPEIFDTTTLAIIKTNLPAGLEAMAAVKDGRIKQYAEIERRFGASPQDNELETAEVWNVQTDWDKIAEWRADKDLSWYYEILLYLKDTVLK
jgi:ADP-ribose pyrophosphatase YjhB (NUDIX family)